ncbi:ABC transporter ATP-binding protein [Streptomyces jeddahensis]|uniref:sn-glycerol-3-phosphate import ATP-binding protein UgpC n=1 Tax=Streptomyces jeddahensis TaxID=1716141 RepID=A0A177HNM0_9ACTN|nr:ABC transporter ATP-binding protein [Streptomyces jeddahensis]OAH12336.1 sn-glycerol-3-phosphate import ATP-binding protein UgpC [Streptomyces jeddahensis]
MPGLEVRDLVKRLGDHTAVDGLGFQVEEGEFFVLLGPSGCGKSTTLRIVCGLEQPDAGRVVVAGRDVTALPPRERNLGMVFQEYGLYPSMDVFGNMAYGLQAQGGLSEDEIRRRVEEAAERLGLTPHLASPVTDLSGGEQQRVALGRAMVKDADAYLYDEPLSNLDPKMRHRVRRDILAMHRDKGKPTVYVTHDQTEAFAMGDRVAVVARGKVQQIGPATELAENPANMFVASFIGSPPMNLLPGRIRDNGSALSVEVEDTLMELPEHWRGSLAGLAGGQVVVGLPPGSFRISAGNGLKGEIADVEALIGETVVRLRTPGGAELSVVFRDGEEGQLRVGETLSVSAVSNDARLFDPATERALTRD